MNDLILIGIGAAVVYFVTKKKPPAQSQTTVLPPVINVTVPENPIVEAPTPKKITLHGDGAYSRRRL